MQEVQSTPESRPRLANLGILIKLLTGKAPVEYKEESQQVEAYSPSKWVEKIAYVLTQGTTSQEWREISENIYLRLERGLKGKGIFGKMEFVQHGYEKAIVDEYTEDGAIRTYSKIQMNYAPKGSVLWIFKELDKLNLVDKRLNLYDLRDRYIQKHMAKVVDRHVGTNEMVDSFMKRFWHLLPEPEILSVKDIQDYFESENLNVKEIFLEGDEFYIQIGKKTFEVNMPLWFNQMGIDPKLILAYGPDVFLYKICAICAIDVTVKGNVIRNLRKRKKKDPSGESRMEYKEIEPTRDLRNEPKIFIYEAVGKVDGKEYKRFEEIEVVGYSKKVDHPEANAHLRASGQYTKSYASMAQSYRKRGLIVYDEIKDLPNGMVELKLVFVSVVKTPTENEKYKETLSVSYTTKKGRFKRISHG